MPRLFYIERAWVVHPEYLAYLLRSFKAMKAWLIPPSFHDIVALLFAEAIDT